MGTGEDTKAFKRFSQDVDFGRAASEYRKFRAGFPLLFFARIATQYDLRPGLRVLDLGTGTGTVARGVAQLGLEVCGLDPSASLLREAEELDREAGVGIDYVEGKAENIPFGDSCFDLVTAGQCWHWFDRPRAAEEVMRVLKPGGKLVVCHFDWIPIAGNVVAATEAMILEANPGWLPMAGGNGVHPQWLSDMSQAGFTKLETASFDLDQPYSHEAWIGRIKASAGIKATLDEAATNRFADELAQMLHANFPENPLAVPHRVWWASGHKPFN